MIELEIKSAGRGANEAHGKVEYVFGNNTLKGVGLKHFSNSKTSGYIPKYGISVWEFKPR